MKRLLEIEADGPAYITSMACVVEDLPLDFHILFQNMFQHRQPEDLRPATARAILQRKWKVIGAPPDFEEHVLRMEPEEGRHKSHCSCSRWLLDTKYLLPVADIKFDWFVNLGFNSRRLCRGFTFRKQCHASGRLRVPIGTLLQGGFTKRLVLGFPFACWINYTCHEWLTLIEINWLLQDLETDVKELYLPGDYSLVVDRTPEPLPRDGSGEG